MWSVAKEWRELVASRAWWVMLIAIGPLVGVSFINAVRTYAEASGLGGTSAGVGEAFSPLIGIWAPTFGACELAAAFLLPFVGIRLVAGDRQSGALKIELQHRMPVWSRMIAKALVLLAGWTLAMVAPLSAILLWKAYGGAIYAPELVAVGLGHLLNAGLTISLAVLTAAVAEHPSTAAILTLGVTVGSWIVNFIAAVQGGFWERVASYTPTAMVSEFQHGLVRLDEALISVILVAGGIGVAAVWLRLGIAKERRASESIGLAALTALAVLASTTVSASWDLSENRMNSFSERDEAALRQIHEPLRIIAHLAPQDPRRFDLEHQALTKLRRVMPGVDVRYESATSIGLFEQTSAHYGEIWYDLNGRRTTSRLTSEEGVLETIFGLAGVSPGPGGEDAEDALFRGHPLASPPRGAAAVFYLIWPAAIVACGSLVRRRGI